MLTWIKGASFRIVAFHIMLFSLFLAALLSVIYVRTSAEFVEEHQERISEEVRRLKAIHQKGGLPELIKTIDLQSRSSRLHGLFYDLRDSSQRQLAGNLELPVFTPGWGEASFYDEPNDIEEKDKTSLITWGFRLGTNETVVVAANHERADDLLEVIFNAAAMMAGLTLILALATGLFTSKTIVQRVNLISDTSRAIMNGDLTRRVPLQGSGDEFDHLSANINKMLQRIEELMQTVRQVSNDIAHDLRTPLGRLRQNLERARLDEHTVESLQQSIDDAISETDQIIETFNALLSIGQIEAGKHRERFAQTNLTDIVQRIFDTYQPVAHNKQQQMIASIEPGIHIQGDRLLLSQMLANLIENAINHCPAKTRIEVTLLSGSEVATLTISDNGPGIPSGEREKVVRPFYRLEKSRTTHGSGLGLALVNVIANLHGIHLNLSDSGPGLTVKLRMTTLKTQEPPVPDVGLERTT